MTSSFIAACKRQPTPYVPVWFMRQAGRYQPEYQEIRKQHTLMDIVHDPALCAEVTRLPVAQLGVDAAILFSDIMVPIGAMGLAFEIKEGVGPVIDTPIRVQADVDKLSLFDPAERLPHVLTTIRLLKQTLSVPLIGFTGAPFTLASYMVEGGPSRNYVRTKQLMWSRPDMWQTLMDKLADMIISYLTAQIEAGAAAVQIFDSWVGSLAPVDFTTYILPTMQRIFQALKSLAVPTIYFAGTNGQLLESLGATGADVLGVDWRVPIAEARRRTEGKVALQGNLDSTLLFAPWPVIEQRAKQILDAGQQSPGFIFNLGQSLVHHNPPVDPETLRRLAQFVHDYTRSQPYAQEGPNQ